MNTSIHIVESAKQYSDIENIQKRIWGVNDVVPSHLLRAITHNGGVLLGATPEGKEEIVGFLFGFIGIMKPDDEKQIKHCSHILGVLPEFENKGIGYALKRAQWQLVRQQGIEVITWTYDPLLSKNAYFNINRLGAICRVYYEDYYGEMTDNLNQGLPSDRFQVELWVNSPRVIDRMSKRPRPSLDLGHYFAVGAEIINPTKINKEGWIIPPDSPWIIQSMADSIGADLPPELEIKPPIYLLEIPSDLQQLRQVDQKLALTWRQHTRLLFQNLFQRGYLVTDFIYLKDKNPRSFYVLSDGERTLGD